jgi:hypothetical protein
MSDIPTASPVGAANPLRKALIGLGGFLMWPLFFVLFSGAPACMGFEEPTLRTMEACPEVVAALGTPIHRSWMGMSCGNAESSDSFGQASWSFPVEGPNGSGSVDVVAERRGGPWMIYSANVETSAGTYEAVACSGGGAGGRIVARTLSATVSTATGPSPAAVGGTCTIDVGPGDGPFPCRVRIDCGGNVLYGAGSTGYTECTLDGSGGVIATDPNTSDVGNDPQLTLSVTGGTAMLNDISPAGPWVMVLSFPPGG